VSDLTKKVEETIFSRRLLSRGEKVLVAVSGGLDSMVLLHILANLAPKHGWKLAVAHFNHQLRGRSSDADERLVRQTAGRLKLPFVVGCGDVRKYVKESFLKVGQRKYRPSIEMAARDLRHKFFAEAARKNEIGTIALGHHSNDQIELFFIRLLRGWGTSSLAGMKQCAPSPVDPAIRLVRPLLDCTRQEIESYGKECKIPFREDASNACLDFQRNRIRHKLIPLLKEMQPALDDIIPRGMEIIGAEADFLENSLRDWSKKKCFVPFENLPLALQRRIIHVQLSEMKLFPDFELIETLRAEPNYPVAYGTDFTVFRDEVGKLHRGTLKRFEFSKNQLSVDLGWERRGRGDIKFGGLNISWKFQKICGNQFSPQPNVELFNGDKIYGPILLRHWRPGDRFQPIGMKSPVKLQDLFTNLKIPRAERLRRVVAVATAHMDSEVFWVEGLRISEEFKLTPSTRRRLCWSWKS
jgi:tRNA(Ile)-lysidine synthase